MEIFAIIMSGAALFAAAVSLYRSEKNRQALETEKARWENQSRAQKKVNKAIVRLVKEMHSTNSTVLLEIEAKIEALEAGAAPDYEKSKAAAQAVNDFAAGLTGILNFDPYAALKAQREKDARGDTE